MTSVTGNRPAENKADLNVFFWFELCNFWIWLIIRLDPVLTQTLNLQTKHNDTLQTM